MELTATKSMIQSSIWSLLNEPRRILRDNLDRCQFTFTLAEVMQQHTFWLQ